VIKFECDTCFQEYKVRDERAGQTLKCKSCGQKMRVPTGDEELLDDIYDDFQTPARPARKKKSSGSSKKKSSGKSNLPLPQIVGVCAFAIVFYISYTVVSGLFRDKNEVVQNASLDAVESNPVSDPSAKTTAPNRATSAPSAAVPAQETGLSADAELAQLDIKMGKYIKEVKATTNREEKLAIYAKMNTIRARMKILIDQRKVKRAAQGGSKPAIVKNKSDSEKQVWTSLVDPPLVTAAWPESSKISIDLKDMHEEPVLPYSFSPFIGLRHESTNPYITDVWNLVTAEKVGQVSISTPSNMLAIQPKPCLSMDGKYLLMSFLSKETKTPILTSWDVTTGQKVAEWEADLAKSINTVFAICGSNRAFAKILRKDGKQFKAFLKLWDITTGKLLVEKEIKTNQFTGYDYKISPGGKYLISNSINKLTIFDLNSLELIQVIDFKKMVPADFGYVSIKGLDISANGKELGILASNSDTTSVWVLDLANKELTLGYKIAGDLGNALSDPRYEGNSLMWNPTGNSWLLYGAWLVNRQKQRLVWTLKPVPNVIMRDEVIVTPNYLLVETATALSDARGRILLNQKPKLISLSLPETKIADSLAAYESQSDAILGAGQKVSLEVKIGDVKFSNVDEVKTILNDVFQQRLESEGFQVTPDQPIVFQIEYQEQDGHKLQLTKRDKSAPGNPLRGTPTGKILQSTSAAFKLSWIDKPAKKTLWSKQARVNPSYLIFRGDATAEAARKQMFESLQKRLMAEAIPYFIPKDKNLSLLPGETQLPE